MLSPSSSVYVLLHTVPKVGVTFVTFVMMLQVLSAPSVIPQPASRLVECLVTSIDAERGAAFNANFKTHNPLQNVTSYIRSPQPPPRVRTGPHRRLHPLHPPTPDLSGRGAFQRHISLLPHQIQKGRQRPRLSVSRHFSAEAARRAFLVHNFRAIFVHGPQPAHCWRR